MSNGMWRESSEGGRRALGKSACKLAGMVEIVGLSDGGEMALPRARA